MSPRANGKSAFPLRAGMLLGASASLFRSPAIRRRHVKSRTPGKLCGGRARCQLPLCSGAARPIVIDCPRLVPQSITLKPSQNFPAQFLGARLWRSEGGQGGAQSEAARRASNTLTPTAEPYNRPRHCASSQEFVSVREAARCFSGKKLRFSAGGQKSTL